MAIIKSSTDHLTLNADGASKDIKFQANGVEKASISSAGAFTSTTIDATALTGNLPAISAASLTSIPAGNLTGALPAISGASLTSLTSGNLTGALPAISGASLTNLPGGGKVLQVVQTVKTDIFSTTTDYANVTDLSVTITPSSTSSKILIMTDVSYGGSSQNGGIRLARGSTSIYIADSASSRPRLSAVQSHYGQWTQSNLAKTFLDSPSTTSATTYNIQLFTSDATTVYVNRSEGDRDTSQYESRSASSITVMEIGA